MLKEFVEKIIDLKTSEIIYSDGLAYTPLDLEPVKPPQPTALQVGSLSSLVKYISENKDGVDLQKSLLHIDGPGQVSLISHLSSDWKMREMLIQATLKNYPTPFRFDEFMSAEQLMIQLQSRFVQDSTTKMLLKLVGNMKSEKIQTSSDDGVTQVVSAKAGVMLVDMVAIPNPVALAPFRTFIEIEQPVSNFIFRVKQGREGELPLCALFEADGGAWKLEAMKRIGEYLENHIQGKVSILS